ncbi:SGNH/GDSL hydrolase family protein [Aspergillus homomorphus CBS 101889]|uniref:Carbohydrate esterase family 16 protein n=1 Tax=Aspergillus homomorphus (strain CBS 101889) TaxID=1450537 RepID=A0A395I6L7_ASPHC|nr:hypothetical protein BO97DRAFT_458735 [Aspergillus homomorphus CBS 101889]RAL15800.1 hypothetical protein BO97DRAFT_458735 [Aspergillus homomorphus CBS 101889]
MPVSELLGSNVSYLFTFGDSYTTTSFNVSSMQPSPSHPMGNPSLGLGTAADGINWVGYLATSFNHTLTLSYNLAVYGATIDNTVIPNEPGDLVYQVSYQFRQHYCVTSRTATETSAPPTTPAWTTDAALFAIWIGINDVQFSYLSPDPILQITAALDTYAHLLQELYDCGARHFLVLNVPPITRTPQMLTYDEKRRARHLTTVKAFNLQLVEMVTRWRQANPDTTMVIYDVFASMSDVLDDPMGYGFRDERCMGKGCVWWDNYHPRSHFHRILAEDLERVVRLN